MWPLSVSLFTRRWCSQTRETASAVQAPVSLSRPTITESRKPLPPIITLLTEAVVAFSSCLKRNCHKTAVNMAIELIRFITGPRRDSQATSQYPSRAPQLSTISSLDEFMASATSPNVQGMIEAINRDGFLYLKDPVKGLQVDEFARKGFPITTIEGVDFCKVHTFDDPVRRHHSLSLLLS